MSVRVRFAPSPTGPLHLGGVRTALYNYLFAKHNKGSFILRIEDTDQARTVEGAEAYIIEALKWTGINYNEGPDLGGPYEPYRQSDRKELYHQYVKQLVDKGHAYYAFDTADELEAMRQRQKNSGSSILQYDSHTRTSMNNSLTLSEEEVNERIARGDAYVIRVKILPAIELKFNDLIRGEIVVNTNQLDDKVLFKSDGMPTYHLAHLVDDYLMKITHVIRGEEWLPSAPLHYLLYDFFGWENVRPTFAHLPLILRPDGNGKLSKRDGDRLGFPVFPLNWKDPENTEFASGFREKGFFPEAFVNMIALLGWNPPSHKEILTVADMIEEFSMERVHKGGAKFDFEKAKWFNHEYMKSKPGDEIAKYLKPILDQKGITVTDDYVEYVCEVLKHRCTFVSEIWSNGYFFFEDPVSYDETIIRKLWNETAKRHIEKFVSAILLETDFSLNEIDKFIHVFLENQKIKAGDLLPLLRVMLIGIKNGPAVFEIISVLGKERSVNRIETATKTFDHSYLIPNK